MKTLMVDLTFDELPEKILEKCREIIKKELKTIFTRESDGWTIHCEFLGELVQHKDVHDIELEENEIIELFYAKNIEPALIDLLLSGQHDHPFNIALRIV